MKAFSLLLLLLVVAAHVSDLVSGFVPATTPTIHSKNAVTRHLSAILSSFGSGVDGRPQDDLRRRKSSSSVVTLFGKRIDDKRRAQLDIADDEDEYDLDQALRMNTDDTINKIVAGSFILVILVLLVVGVVVPSLTDYGEGVCNPLLTAGRC